MSSTLKTLLIAVAVLIALAGFVGGVTAAQIRKFMRDIRAEEEQEDREEVKQANDHNGIAQSQH